MPELADKIVKFYGSSADMGAVLVMIMREIGYYEENQIQQFQNRLDRMNRQSLLERSKERGDLLLDKGRFECAVQIYSQTLQMPRDLRQKPQFYGQILQHMGVAYLAWDMRMRRWMSGSCLCRIKARRDTRSKCIIWRFRQESHLQRNLNAWRAARFPDGRPITWRLKHVFRSKVSRRLLCAVSERIMKSI